MRKFLPIPLIILCLTLISGTWITAQDLNVQGTLVSTSTLEPLADVLIVDLLSGKETKSDAGGNFTIILQAKPEITLQYNYEGQVLQVTYPTNGESSLQLGQIRLDFLQASGNDQIFTITLAEDDEGEFDGENISGVLTASRDVFLNTAAFTFGPARFRVRGYDSENAALYLNNIPINDLEDGRPFWGQWGGLNDVTRSQEVSLGSSPALWSFGGVMGSTMIDLRARSQRVQKKVTYSRANRSYNNRLMGTWSTGLMDDGWAISASLSRRWAEEGYVEGTFYDSYGYFLSVDKKLSEKHFLNGVFLGAPNIRGKNGAATQELYDLAGTNYYNPYWGYQNGEKRNSRVSNSHQPIAMLRHDWNLGTGSVLSTSIGAEFGKYGSTALDWYNANDPRPDYYRRLPSYQLSPELAEEVRAVLTGDESLLQIQWDKIYETNLNNSTTIEDVDGIEGNDITGKLSNYIIEDRHYDNKRYFFNTNLQHVINDKVTLSGGLHYIYQTIETYKLVEDLLGGEFYVDFDKFAERDIPDNPNARQNDLNNPNRLVGEGDIFGYHYDGNIREASLWSQFQYVLPGWEFHLSANLSKSSFWRTGYFRNGKFPDNSFGDSEKQDFTNYGLKGGALLKINGRNYISLNGTYMTRAPFFRNAYVSPRTRDEVVADLKSETIRSGELSYILRSPGLKGRLTGYYTEFLDQTVSRSFYHDDQNSFVNLSMTGVDKEHMGVEAALEATIFTDFKAHAVASVGQFIYTSRPSATITQDNNAEVLQEDVTIYAKNFYVAGTPQSAYNFGLSWKTKNYLSFYLNFNYFDDLWIDFNPIRRTAQAIELVEPESPEFSSIIAQEKVDGAFTMDFTVFKSFIVNWFDERTYIGISFSVNNVLNNQDFISGGYEQLRFDFEEKDVEAFPSRYYYFNGLNYFFNVFFSF